MKIDIAVLEDNEQDFLYLSSLLSDWSHHTNNPVTITRFAGTDIIQNFTTNNYDLLFADIELKGAGKETGISICEKLRASGFNNEILFLTAFKEYVFEGYGVKAFNYLVKPVTDEKLSVCMERFLEFHTKNYYILQDRSNLIQLNFKDIMYITKEGNNALIHTQNGTHYERISLSEITDKLTHTFIQCHKSTIVNILHINYLSRAEISLTDGTKITVGRNHLTQVRNALLDYSKFA